MKFEIVSAVIKTVRPDAEQNAGSKYVEAVIAPISQFMSNEHKACFFPNAKQLLNWEAQIAANAFPEYPAKYEVVSGLPLFRVKNRKGQILPEAHDSMRVLVMIDPSSGEVLESGRAIAMQIIHAMMELVVVADAPADNAPVGDVLI